MPDPDASLSVSAILCSLSHLLNDRVRWHHVISFASVFDVFDEDVRITERPYLWAARFPSKCLGALSRRKQSLSLITAPVERMERDTTLAPGLQRQSKLI